MGKQKIYALRGHKNGQAIPYVTVENCGKFIQEGTLFLLAVTGVVSDFHLGKDVPPHVRRGLWPKCLPFSSPYTLIPIPVVP